MTSGLSNTDLLNALHEAASDLSYYNAAEGDCYTQEAGARRISRMEFTALRDGAISRGIYDADHFNKNYLI